MPDKRLGSLALPVIGIACLWLCFRISFFFSLVDSPSALPFQAEILYSAFLISCSLALFASAFFHNAIDLHVLSNRKITILIGALLPASFLVLRIALASFAIPMFIPLVLSIASGVGSAALLLGWMNVLLRKPASSASAAIAIAFSVHMALACGTALLGSNFFGVVLIAAALLATISLGGMPQDAPSIAKSSNARSNWMQMAFRDPISVRTLKLVAVFIYVSALLWGILSPEKTGTVSLAEHLSTFIIAGITFLLLLAGNYKASRRFSFRAVSTVLSALFFTALFILLGFKEESKIGTSALMAAIFCFEAFAWMGLVSLAPRSSRSASQLFGVGLPCLVLIPTLIRNICAPLLLHNAGPLPYIPNKDTLILLATFVLVISTVTALGFDKPSRRQTQTIQVGDIARKKNLTPRETDVLVLLAKGNSQKKISEELCIAPTTVQSHVKAIYRKLGVHSRQDLIDYCSRIDLSDHHL